MTTAKVDGHTEGPWTTIATDASIDDNFQWADDDGAGHVQRINTWVGIGNPELTEGMVAIAVFNGVYDDPEYDANVALLCAAPDLLEAVQAFVAYDDGVDRDDVDQMLAYGEAINKARAALTRALAQEGK